MLPEVLLKVTEQGRSSLFRCLIFSFLFFIFSCKKEESIFYYQKKEDLIEDSLKNDSNQIQKNKNDTISITAVGDLMVGSQFPSKKFLPKDDAVGSFDEVKEFFTGDIVFGNLEGVFLDNGVSEKCKDKEPGLCYVFQMPERYGEILKNAGFNLLSTANNHARDFGELGIKTTEKILEENQIHYAGAVPHHTTIFEKNGVKFGFCAFAPNARMKSILNISEAEEIVKEIDNQVDVCIVSFHGGGEGDEFSNIKKENEFYFGENRGNVHFFAHKMIDAGADLILGHGPHIPRAVELYKNKLIAYSLGNFNTYGRFSLVGNKGIAPLLNIKIKKNGDFISSDVISIKQIKNVGVKIDKTHRAYHQVKKLTEMDFPETPLEFKNYQILKK